MSDRRRRSSSMHCLTTPSHLAQLAADLVFLLARHALLLALQ
jgi:hypothetical protein